MTDLDAGQWLIVHPGELVATFLLPLPDPIALADGTVLPSHRWLEPAAIDLLHPWLSELWLQELGGPGVESCSVLVGDDQPGDLPVNWSNKVALRASIQFHQVFSDASLRIGIEPAMKLAEVVSGARLGLSDKAKVFDELHPNRPWSSEDLRQLALGHVTVAECAIGLRIVGDVPDLDSPLLPDSDMPPFGPVESDMVYPEENAMWQWRCYPSGSEVNLRVVERRLRNALSICLSDIQSIQKAVQSIRRTPTVVATIERLPVLVPVILRKAGDIGDPDEPVMRTLLATGRSGASALITDPLNDEEMSHLNKAREIVDGGPFAAHLDLHREGQIALGRLGDHRLAALLFGISAESLLDELLLHLLWEEGKTPEQAAQAWIEGLDTRVRTELPGRLGGSWDFSLTGAVGEWARRVAALRNRVAHAGYAPSEDESRSAMAALDALVTHVCDRLANPKVLRSYPRTALALAGEQGLRRRKAFSRRIQNLQEDPNEVRWVETFFRWRESWRRTRQDLTTTRRATSQSDSWLLAVRHADHSLHWIRHNRELHLAIEVSVSENDLPQEFIEKVHALADISHSSGYKLPISVGGQYVFTTLVSGALWVEEYHHVPMTEVMVDQSDYEQPLKVGIQPI